MTEAERLAERLEELLAKATPGPWYARGSSGLGIVGVGLNPRQHPILQEVDGGRHDIDLAAAAVNALPALIAALRSQVEELERLRDVLRWMDRHADGYMNHVDFRVEATLLARAALGETKAAPEQEQA